MEIREDMASKLVIPGVLAMEEVMVDRPMQDMVVDMDNHHMGTSTVHRETMVRTSIFFYYFPFISGWLYLGW